MNELSFIEHIFNLHDIPSFYWKGVISLGAVVVFRQSGEVPQKIGNASSRLHY
ncbi:MAG: hypothetical protein QS721_14865 [Candidatus Endonucleobacter sp. (ex Gigantidas childressi)]|nr:hypothetical protein [Candidatus Endonucleobacter sp. (ex Gigantidas childressi)]